MLIQKTLNQIFVFMNHKDTIKQWEVELFQLLSQSELPFAKNAIISLLKGNTATLFDGTNKWTMGTDPNPDKSGLIITIMNDTSRTYYPQNISASELEACKKIYDHFAFPLKQKIRVDE